jgi:hypothetical protein
VEAERRKFKEESKRWEILLHYPKAIIVMRFYRTAPHSPAFPPHDKKHVVEGKELKAPPSTETQGVWAGVWGGGVI